MEEKKFKHFFLSQYLQHFIFAESGSFSQMSHGLTHMLSFVVIIFIHLKITTLFDQTH